MLPSHAFFSHWAWWLALVIQLIPAYLMQVRDQLSIQSRNLRWATPGLEMFIFGPKLAFIYRHMLLISFGTLAAVLMVFNWLATLASFAAVFTLANSVAPISKRHAKEILREVGDLETVLTKLSL